MKTEQLAFKDVERFHEWLTTKIQNIHICKDEDMLKAYDRVYTNSYNFLTINKK